MGDRRLEDPRMPALAELQELVPELALVQAERLAAGSFAVALAAEAAGMLAAEPDNRPAVVDLLVFFRGD